MKIGILTWYNARNHGALFQAYALQEFYKSMGAETVMLRFVRNVKKSRDNIFKRMVRVMSVEGYKCHRINRRFAAEKGEIFENFINQHISVGDYYWKQSDIDALSVGSDMIFDFSEGYNSFVYGDGICAPYMFSYAASFGRTTVESIKSVNRSNEIKFFLSKFNALGCRDENTRQILEDFYGFENVVETVDPVVLYGFTKEKEKWDSGKWCNRSPYIAVYAYDCNFKNKSEVRAIKDYAANNNLRLVSIGYNHVWCDESIPCSPEEFLEVIKNAQMVITDTFHGMVFSVIFEKQFRVFIRDNSFKINHFLQSIKVGNEVIVSDIDKNNGISDYTIDYSEISQNVNRLREESKKFISVQFENIMR